ncbi:translation initiation factor IF-2 [Levilactobacillus tujiorum]|uniref:Translation initiation factor IF-2 n=1 Tax=Levilactobacillus tujiorum TaxID=2912243 RepID=A0ABX1L5T7_9LACO|nr:translation initiation factor IF-2 [Levilactobacillus tujiorum]MCH5464261.1 translation initiation factor IF-2 [Levilactobacillus tujiorum]NLR11304.1 translation initiation factor IF-2 [Lactobacillus sp. HBUAS51387]NLR29242.1 translation initiation factor IF-2 [Levilactobacillus tujiorum]
MGKKRIYELAKEINVSSKQIIAKAEEKGFPVKNHMSTLGENEERQLREAFSKRPAGKPTKSQPAKRPAVEAARPAGQKNDHPKTSHKPSSQGNSSRPANHGQSGQNGNQQAANHANHSGSRSQQRSTSTNNKNNNGQSGKQHTEQHHSGTGRFGGSLNNNTNNSNGRRGSNGNSRGGRNNRNNRNNRRRNNNNNRYKKNQRIKDTNQHKGAPERKNKALPEVLVYTDGMNAQDLAKILHRSSAEIVKKLFMLGVMVNQNQSLDKDTIEILADDYGIQAQEKVQVDVTDLDKFFDAEMENKDHLETRAPVVTIMGHVDHGKTTLLDHLRHSHITEGEAGGITQAIGAYQVHYNDKSITFLDTPGHAAFTEMRARGAEITDITVLVVAADDGVMPQTIEAIHHAKAAGTPIIVAVNKIDKPGANPNHVMEQLTEYELIPEDWGGDTIFVEISAKFGKNIDELLDMILLQAEVLELKANPEQNGVGSVIEARLDQGRGSVATLLVQQGTLHVGDPIVVGNTFGKVRTMTNERGRRIKDAKPSTPVEITGLNDVPEAGDRFVVFDDEKTARAAGEERAKEALVQERKNTSHVTLDNLFDSLKEGEMKEVDVIIKADVQGSVEALAGSLKKIDVSGVRVNIIHSAVGAINESDVTLAEASDAIIIGFNVRPTPQARAQADSDKVDIRLHNVIYNAIDEIETAMKGMLEPTYEEQVTGQVEVKDIFHASKVGTIVGGMVTEGYITADADVRLIRDGVVIYEGKLGSLKRFKDDVKQVKMGYELGLTIENYNDIKVDDVIEAYVMKEVPVK